MPDLGLQAELLEAALGYAGRGLPVFPCKGKRPHTEHGFHDASTDTATVLAWWQRWPTASIGIPTGAASGIDVLDVDVQHGGAGTLAGLERERGKLPATVEVLTPGGGRHYWFKHGRELKSTAATLGPGLDTRGEGGYVVVPPSVGENGRAYRFTRDPENVEPAEPPAWLFEEAEERRNGPAAKMGDTIPEGQRRAAMLTVAGKLKRAGLAGEEILPTLRELNKRCKPPLDESELESVAFKSTIAATPETAIRTTPATEPCAIEEAVAVFQRWLWLPDTSAVYATLGAAAANYLDGAPVWLLLVGPPGSGKTETLGSLLALPDVYATAVLSEPALLSGTPRKEHASEAKGGLLRELGDFGLILCKDFGSLLSMRHDARTPVLAALREVYDGSWTRHVGSEGGRSLAWQGKAGFMGGCTPTIDRHYAVVATMGDRFLLFRMPRTDAGHQAATALNHGGDRETAMRRELGAAAAGLFSRLDRSEHELDDDERKELIRLAVLVARCRSAVERDSYHTREIELVPEPEAPARLVKSLERLRAGLLALGADKTTLWEVVRKTALDSMPALRRAVIDTLVERAEPATTTAIAETVLHPTITTRRVLEDLAAHGVAVRYPQGKGKADLWGASDWLRQHHAQ